MTTLENTKKRVTKYWAKRSESFLQDKIREFHSELANRWITELQSYLPKDKKTLKILDIGCGTGFLTGLLAKMGHQVIGIDLTEEMIHYAHTFATMEAFDADFLVMDAEQLQFENESFDVVIARNVTWTLPHVEQAYQEWLRVLRPEGVLVNIDGNYGASAMNDTEDLPEHHAHQQLSYETLSECEAIQRSLEISKQERPSWDIHFLLQQSIAKLSVDMRLSSKIYVEKDEFYNPTPLFLLAVMKHEEVLVNVNHS